MRRKISAVLICLSVLIAVFTGCSAKSVFPDDIVCKDIMQAAVDATAAPDYDNIYTLSDPAFDSYAMSLWADGLYEECSEFNLITDCAIYIGVGNSAYEVGVFKTESEADAEKMKEVFTRRKATMAAGDKGAYDPNFSAFLEDSVIYTDGAFAVFLMTDDNDAARAAINELKSAK